MQRTIDTLAFGALNLALVLTTVTFAAPPADEAGKADTPSRVEEVFANRVLPIFREKCFACHGDDADDVRGEFNMLTREGLLRGGESEESSLVPGKPDESPLLQAIKWDGLEMPPKENDRLTELQIAYVEEWIAGGAPWPDKDRLDELIRTTGDKWNAADGVQVATSGGLSDEWTDRRYKPENLWAYQPLARSEVGRDERCRFPDQREAGQTRPRISRASRPPDAHSTRNVRPDWPAADPARG
jgi:mono/diheme cytochrome c family protein